LLIPNISNENLLRAKWRSHPPGAGSHAIPIKHGSTGEGRLEFMSGLSSLGRSVMPLRLVLLI